MHAMSPPRPLSPARPVSRLNPKSHPQTLTPSVSTKTHLANLERVLRKTPQYPPNLRQQPNVSRQIQETPPPQSSNHFLNALTIPTLFNRTASAANDDMSPRSVTRFTHLLSSPPGPSPRNPIAGRWRQFHGASDWAGMLDPLNEDLRRELVRYGDLVQSAYHAYFNTTPAVSPSQPRPVLLPDRSYRVVGNLFATSSLHLPDWVPGAADRSSWIGYVAVCDNEREITRLGRRDIVIALRGTATSHEWAENFRADLVPAEKHESARRAARVERGFRSLFRTAGAHVPSLATGVVEQVRRLMEQYEGEELSITVTGHSLGAALAVLVADELSTCAPQVPPIAVISFGGPRVGNRAFGDRVERRGVKVLRVVNAHDLITRVPGVMPHVTDGYEHVGRELRVDSKHSPYLRPNADPACCHDLEAYLHLVDGFMASNCPFRSNAKRSLVRLLDQQGPNLKQKYVSMARGLVVDPVRSGSCLQVQGVLASPSQ